MRRLLIILMIVSPFSFADEPAVSQEFLHNVARTTQSMSRLEAMADTGNCAAMQQLGKVHLNTSDTVTLRKDNDFKSYSFTKAADYFRAAVECGLDSSKVWDEYNLKIHKYDNAEKITKKVSWYKEAASDGFPIAQRILAVHLGYVDESLQLLEKSGDSGDNKSLILLASRYTLGLGVNPSPSIAKSYLDQVQSPSPEFLNAWRDLNNSTKGRFSAQYDAAFAGLGQILSRFTVHAGATALAGTRADGTVCAAVHDVALIETTLRFALCQCGRQPDALCGHRGSG